jgi:hypothetical protein
MEIYERLREYTTKAPKTTHRLAKSKKPRVTQDKAIPLWAQLRMAYEFATPKERAKFDAMAKDVIKRGKVAGKAGCPNDCTAYQNPLQAGCPNDCTAYQNPLQAGCPHDCTEYQNPFNA